MQLQAELRLAVDRKDKTLKKHHQLAEDVREPERITASKEAERTKLKFARRQEELNQVLLERRQQLVKNQTRAADESVGSAAALADNPQVATSFPTWLDQSTAAHSARKTSPGPTTERRDLEPGTWIVERRYVYALLGRRFHTTNTLPPSHEALTTPLDPKLSRRDPAVSHGSTATATPSSPGERWSFWTETRWCADMLSLWAGLCFSAPQELPQSRWRRGQRRTSQTTLRWPTSFNGEGGGREEVCLCRAHNHALAMLALRAARTVRASVRAVRHVCCAHCLWCALTYGPRVCVRLQRKGGGATLSITPCEEVTSRECRPHRDRRDDENTDNSKSCLQRGVAWFKFHPGCGPRRRECRVPDSHDGIFCKGHQP